MASVPVAPAATALAAWRQRLREVVLPAVNDAGGLKAMRDGCDNLDASEERIGEDLPVALALLVDAARSPRTAANFSGLQHVLHLIGSNALRYRLQSWKAGSIDPGVPAHRLALQAMATSRLACWFHSHWMRHGRIVADAEYRMWVTALLGVARWKLPLAAPELAQQIEQRTSAGERRARVERELLGCDVDSLAIAHLQDLGFTDAGLLAERLRLSPRLLGSAARHAHADALPDPLQPALARRLREPLVSAGLAYTLALETQQDWHSPRCRRLIDAAATCFNLPAEVVVRDLHCGALAASGEALYTRGLLAPAARLIRIPQPRPRVRAKPAVAATATTTTPPPPGPASAETRAAPVRAATTTPAPSYTQRCRDQAFASLAELLQASAAVLQRAGLARCALFLHMRQPERIAAYYTQGFTDATAARRTSLPSVAGTLLERLLANPRGAYLVTPEQLPVVLARLPEALAAWPAEAGFVLATVQANERPLGFWWASAGDGAEAIGPTQFAALRQMAAAFGGEFTRLLRAQRAAQQAASA